MNTDTHGSNEEEWIGFDLDGTLAKYDGWKGVEHIGEPVTTMVVVAKLLHWLGKKIKILTAGVAPREDGDGGDKAKKYIEKWCEKNLGFVPEITHLKDASMAALFDDRAVAVEQNTGKVLGGWPDFLPKATEKAKKAVLGGTKWKAKTLAVKKRRDPDGIESEKSAGIELSDGKYDDVKKVYESLTDKERDFVTPGRTVYKDVPKFLTGRTVAYDGGEPVGFSDIYGYNSDGSLRSSPNICIAVSDSARGRGLAGSMTKDVIKKVISRAREIRREKGARADRVKRLVWMAVRGNEASVRAAQKFGFKERPNRSDNSRKFTMSRRNLERVADSD